MSTVTVVGLTLLFAAAALCLRRLLRGFSVADRVVALDSLLVVVAGGIAVWSAERGDGAFLDAMVVVALVAFTGTITVARYIERRGAR